MGLFSFDIPLRMTRLLLWSSLISLIPYIHSSSPSLAQNPIPEVHQNFQTTNKTSTHKTFQTSYNKKKKSLAPQ